MSTKVLIKTEGHEACFTIPLLTNPTHIGPVPRLDLWSVCSDVDEVLVRQLQAIATIAAATEHLPQHEAITVRHALGPSMMAVERRVPKLKFDPRPQNGPKPDPHLPKRSG